MKQIFFIESVSMNYFCREISQKLDMYEPIDNINDANAIFNDSLWFLPKWLWALG